MSFDEHKDLAVGSIAIPPSPPTGAGTCTLETGLGAVMPAVPFDATIRPAGQEPTHANAEIVRVKKMSGDKITEWERGKAGTTARTIQAGDRIAASITTQVITTVENAITAETARAKAEETALASAVTAEATARASGDTAAITTAEGASDAAGTAAAAVATHAGLTTTAHGGLIPSSAKGAPSGVATLDANGHHEQAQYLGRTFYLDTTGMGASGEKIDIGPTIQAAFDFGWRRILIYGGGKPWIKTPVFYDDEVANDQKGLTYRIDADDHTPIFLDATTLPTVDKFSLEAGVGWAFHVNQKRTAWNTETNVVSYSEANRAAGIIGRRLTFGPNVYFNTGESTPKVGVVYANSCGIEFDGVTLERMRYGIGSFGKCESMTMHGGINANTMAENAVLLYTPENTQEGTQAFIAGDCTVIEDIEIGFNPRLTVWWAEGARGGRVSGCVGGGFHFVRCRDIEVSNHHLEGNSDAPFLYIDRSFVRATCISHGSQNKRGSTVWSSKGIVINDTGEEIQHSLLEIEMMTEYVNLDIEAEHTQLPNIEIQSMHPNSKIRARGLTQGISVSTAEGKPAQIYLPSSVAIVSSVEAIQTALTAGRTLLAGGQWELARSNNSEWAVTPVSPLQGITTPRRLTAPTLANGPQNDGSVGGTLTEPKMEYVAACLDVDGNYTTLSSVLKRVVSNSHANMQITVPTFPCVVRLFKIKGEPGTVKSTPDAYVDILAGSAQLVVYDTGVYANQIAWVTASVPVPETVAAANGTWERIRFPDGRSVGHGSGTPESVIAAPIGSVYTDEAAGTMYLKITGSGKTGWEAAGTAKNKAEEERAKAAEKAAEEAAIAAAATKATAAETKAAEAATAKVKTEEEARKAAVKAAEEAAIPLTQKGKANGVPETDANNRIPIAEMPLSALFGTAVDMCRAPYNCVGGEDITAKLQEAIEAVATLGGGKLYFGKPGVYLLNGAMKEGEVSGNKYKGQVLFPYVKTTETRVPIEIEGCNPVTMESWAAAVEPVSTLGVALVSNLTSTPGNNVFSTMTGTGAISNVEVRFRNILLGCTAAKPELTMCQFENALCADLTNVHVTVWKASSEITVGGSGYGVRLPKIANGAHATMRDCEVNGFGYGVSHSEHAVLDNVAIRRAKVALRPSGGPANLAEYRKVHVKNCNTVIEPEGSGCVLFGTISVEDEVAEMVIKDKTNLLTGTLTIRQDKAENTNTLLTMEGGKNLVLQSLAWKPGVYTAATSIAVPATTAAVRNTIFRDVNAFITTGASTCKVSINGTELMTIPATTTVAVPWPSGAEITLEYASAPTWQLLVR